MHNAYRRQNFKKEKKVKKKKKEHSISRREMQNKELRDQGTGWIIYGHKSQSLEQEGREKTEHRKVKF